MPKIVPRKNKKQGRGERHKHPINKLNKDWFDIKFDKKGEPEGN